MAIYSDVDRDALHVRFADEAYHVRCAARAGVLPGDGPRHRDRQARRGAEAIHPGYGFLAENGDFADLCAKEGIASSGPGAT